MSAIAAFTHKPLPENSPYEAVDPFLLVQSEGGDAPTVGDNQEAEQGAAENAADGDAGTQTDSHGATGATGETHSETAAHGDTHGGEKVFPPFDSTTFASQLFWLAITFGLFYYLMSKVILPRIGQTLEQRHDRIATDLAEAERLKGETDAAIAAYEQALADAKAKASEIAKTTRDSVQKTIEADRKAAEAGINEQLEEAEQKIAGIKAEAMDQVETIASDTTEAIIAAISGVKVGKPDVAKAVAEVRGN